MDMDELNSAQFRRRYQRLTAPTVVTVNGHAIGTWLPAVMRREAGVPSPEELGRRVAPEPRFSPPPSFTLPGAIPAIPAVPGPSHETTTLVINPDGSGSRITEYPQPVPFSPAPKPLSKPKRARGLR